MSVKIKAVKAGVATVFIVIQGKDFFLVDAGGRNYAQKVIKAIKSRGLKLSDLKFIFLTHTHYDHAGCAAELKKLSGTKVIVHESEANFLIQGDHFIPKGTNWLMKFVAWIGKRLGKAYSAYPALLPDIVFKKTLSLESFGFNARLISTPGHTVGSSCLVFENMVFAGDTLFNFSGFIFPPFANDPTTLIKSWAILLKENVEWYYPAHGKRISKAYLHNKFQERTMKLKARI